MTASTHVPQTLELELLSDTTFGRGTATAAEVDAEVDHDRWGLPRVGGKVIHGLLRDGWLAMRPQFADLDDAALRVLGPPRDLAETAILRLGDATMDEATREWVAHACDRGDHPIAPAEILRGLTDVRRRTAIDTATGAPARGSLRTVRVALRGLRLRAPLRWLEPPSGEDVRCLALCVLSVRHAGLGRQRGAGRLRCGLDGDRGRTVELARGQR